jgi:hypothetical protein
MSYPEFTVIGSQLTMQASTQKLRSSTDLVGYWASVLSVGKRINDRRHFSEQGTGSEGIGDTTRATPLGSDKFSTGKWTDHYLPR